jgi:hypothetical protein
MLKMQVDPEKCMKTKGSMTKCPRKIAILCPSLQNSREIFAFLHEILSVLRTKTESWGGFTSAFGEASLPVHPAKNAMGLWIEDSPGGKGGKTKIAGASGDVIENKG